VLGFESVEVLGYISSFAGIGMLVGGVLVSIFGVPNHRVLTILFLSFIQGTNLLTEYNFHSLDVYIVEWFEWAISLLWRAFTKSAQAIFNTYNEIT
jgi:hypothetical protein